KKSPRLAAGEVEAVSRLLRYYTKGNTFCQIKPHLQAGGVGIVYYTTMWREAHWERQWKRKFGPGRWKMRTWSTLAMLAFFLFAAGVLSTGMLFAWYAKDLPRPDKVKRSEGLSTVVLDRNGEKLYDIFEDENRILVKWEDIPQTLKDATVAIEDKEFYKHQGLSRTGIIRAMVNIFIFRNLQGGSTLTQQLVKNVLLTKERTLPRKIKEAILAIQIERKYTKDDILRMYLNEAPYGGTAVGVEAASEYYFGKPARQLTLVESAIIAGLPQSPSRYSPFTGDPKAYVGRSQQVLRRMRQDGYISAIQETQAREQLEKITFSQGDQGLRAPHFVAYVRQLLNEKFGEKLVDAGGLTVTTTMDWKLQEKAQAAVFEEVEKAKKLKVGNGAAVVSDPKTGEILAMVGSKDYTATDSGGYKFNVVTQGLRQPGSAIKPITYAAAFKKGYTPSTLLLDVDTKYPSGDPAKPEYNPKNYDSKFRGPIQLRFALGNSINTIAVKVSALVGVRDTLRLAYDMGLTSLEPTDENLKRIGLSLTLGGGEVKLLELSQAFGVFATGGERQDTVALLKVVDSKGKTIFEHKQTSGRRVMSPEIAYLVSDILSDNDARKEIFGLRSYLFIPGKSVAAKTGTTDDKRDNWTVGYTQSVVVGTWVGNNDNSPMHPSLASGATGAAPIWNRIIREALKDKPDEPFVRPGGVVEVEVDAYGGGTPKEGYPTRKERFVRGTEPTAPAAIYKDVKVSKSDANKLASAVQIAKGEYETRAFVVFTEDDPVSTDGKNRWQEGINAWLSGQGDAKLHPPTETASSNDAIAVSIKEPGDQQQINTNDVKVRVEAGAGQGVDKIEIFVDGTRQREVSGSQASETINVIDGVRTIKAKAIDTKGNVAEREIKISVNMPFPTATPTPTQTPTPSPTSTP
ncbi:penicillin-binding protein, partial [Candidatus Gottesmanbacteria bacterium]|nr:penicillin-binding protein [Candidatus Gottesmanbacteria bacterium]